MVSKYIVIKSSIKYKIKVYLLLAYVGFIKIYLVLTGTTLINFFFVIKEVIWSNHINYLYIILI